MAKAKKAHYHEFEIHPRLSWARTHCACTTCGVAIPKSTLSYALEHGATATDALRKIVGL